MHNDYSVHDEEGTSFGFGAGSALRLGDVTYNMLIEVIKDFEVLHVPESCSKRFTWYAPIPSKRGFFDRSHRHEVLFLCHDEVAESLLDDNPSSFCVVLVDDDCVPAWVSRKNRRNRVVIMRQTKRFYFYDSLLQSLFVNDLIWENEMDRVVYNRGRLDRLISLSEEMLGNFVCITDTGYNLIAYSRSIEPPEEGYRYLVDNNCYSEHEVREIEENVLAVAKEKSQLTLCMPNERHRYPALHYPVFIDNAYLFHVVLACESGSLECLQDLFLKFMRRVVSICNDFWKTTVNLESPWHRVLAGLIDGDPMTEDYIDAQLAKTAIPASEQFRLLRFQFSSRKSFQERSRVIEAAKNLNNGFVYPFMHKGDLLVLLYSASVNEAALSGRKTYEDVDEHVYNPFGIAAGASQVFFGIKDIECAYRQALIAYAMRAPLRNEYDALYGSSDIPCYAFEHVLKYYILTEGCDPDLVEFSFDHSILKRLAEEDRASGTEIVRMIWVYLNNGRNATDTAKLVHVHRNTVLYHVSRLEKRFDISFDSPVLRSRMMLDYHRLMLEDHL
ncbi:PucR family transcriptional regulator [Raoultibacter phocaeensis]|uniref:PucR family transcriptional regulator n=1 Tax=Raoultibacter phocaeensis TaxID=2479841 RepID=UPI00111B775B|nr:helix-turn-helix domain-containing protein [Raoultibacter phocaeensis]